MSMRRVFIVRKDLNMKPGKLAAMVGHCCEAYWTNLLKSSSSINRIQDENFLDKRMEISVTVDCDIWDDYVNGIFTKTICEAKNLAQLKKVEAYIDDFCCELVEGEDWGYINDKCLTDFTPENPDGTTTIGVWFKPLPDEIAQKISKKFKLYGTFDKQENEQKN